MFVMPDDSAELARTRSVLESVTSRFCFQMQTGLSRYYARHNNRPAIILRRIRLVRAKPYCGQHAGPCLRRSPRRERCSSYLEGADWVAFNDMLNDAFNRTRLRVSIWSKGPELGLFFTRLGDRSRIQYSASHSLLIAPELLLWDTGYFEGDFSNKYFGRRRPMPRSVFPAGTPGIPEYDRIKAARLERLFALHEVIS